MSDGEFTFPVHFPNGERVLSLVAADRAWAQDTLPDDDLDIPEELVPPLDEFETVAVEDDKWTELGVESTAGNGSGRG